MATFFENLRGTLQNNAPLARALNTTIPLRGKSPTTKDVAKLEAMAKQDATAAAEKQATQRQAAKMGSLDAQDYDNPNQIAALKGHLWTDDDARYYVDRKVFENYDLLNKMADEYGKIKSYHEGEDVLKKYYNKIDGKTSKLNQMFNHFASGNRVLRDTEDYEGNFSDPQEVTNYMKYIFNVAKGKYSSKKV